LVAYQYRQGFPGTLPYQALFVSNIVLVLFELTIIVALVVVAVRPRRSQRARVERSRPPVPVAARVD
jgi:hypothetical protein